MGAFLKICNLHRTYTLSLKKLCKSVYPGYLPFYSTVVQCGLKSHKKTVQILERSELFSSQIKAYYTIFSPTLNPLCIRQSPAADCLVFNRGLYKKVTYSNAIPKCRTM